MRRTDPVHAATRSPPLALAPKSRWHGSRSKPLLRPLVQDDHLAGLQLLIPSDSFSCLPQEDHLAGLLARANEPLHAVAITARSPWRLPLLLGLLGTFSMALDARLSAPAQFARLVAAQSVCMLPRHKLRMLLQSFAGDGTPLAPAAAAALDGDLSASARGGQVYVAQLERLAADHERRWAESQAKNF